jgi:hypothetical protein
MKQILKAGTIMHKGKEIAQNTKIFTIKSGQECYCSSIFLNDDYIYKCMIYIFDLNKFIERNYKEIESYL